MEFKTEAAFRVIQGNIVTFAGVASRLDKSVRANVKIDFEPRSTSLLIFLLNNFCMKRLIILFDHAGLILLV